MATESQTSMPRRDSRPMVDKKATNIQFFRSSLETLLQDPILRNKFVVVQDAAIKGAYDTFEAALRFSVANFPPSEFVIQQVINENEVINFLRAAL